MLDGSRLQEGKLIPPSNSGNFKLFARRAWSMNRDVVHCACVWRQSLIKNNNIAVATRFHESSLHTPVLSNGNSFTPWRKNTHMQRAKHKTQETMHCFQYWAYCVRSADSTKFHSDDGKNRPIPALFVELEAPKPGDFAPAHKLSYEGKGE
jgi:hypothetical protein